MLRLIRFSELSVKSVEFHFLEGLQRTDDAFREEPRLGKSLRTEMRQELEERSNTLIAEVRGMKPIELTFVEETWRTGR
jgi:hypothetical protein